MPFIRRRYSDPPLLEAVAEFRFEPGSPWDQTVPGLVYERVRETFPEKQQVVVVDASLTPGEGVVVEQRVAHIERLQLRRADQAALLQVSPHYLSVSRLPPYEAWEEYLPLIDQGLRAYREVAEPAGIQRIGLRYINRLRIPGNKIELAEYFDFFPHIGDDLPTTHGSFICGVHFPFEDGRDLARVQLADQPSDNGESIFLLDIDYFLNEAGRVDFEEALGWLERAHEHLEEVFEGCLRPALRDTFGEATEVGG
jgi:uncharacterized protein (TIGR04255 family)